MLIRQLSFKFNKRDNNYFFKDLNVEFTPNTVHFIQGDNGVGKSTFFRIIQGRTDKTNMLDLSITLNDAVYTTNNNMLPSSFTQQVHTVQQDYDRMIADQFTFVENLQLANITSYPNLKSLPDARLLDIIARLEINMHKPARTLSGGQRQLLAVFMALQKPTKILLLDEPTATLDKKNAELIIQLLYKLAVMLQVTMLIICHDKTLLEQYASQESFLMQQCANGERILTRYASRNL